MATEAPALTMTLVLSEEQFAAIVDAAADPRTAK